MVFLPYSREFKLFIKRTLLFLLPVVLVFGVLDLLAYRTGELVPVRKVVAYQNEHPEALYGRKVVDQELRRYKYELYLRRGGDILALGSSRILAMREEFFTPYYSFTNLGSIAHNIGDVADFVSRMPVSEDGGVVFLSTDYYWFGDARTAESTLTRDLALPDASDDYKAHIFASRHILNTLLKDREKFSAYITTDEHKESFGFQGREGNGYRSDGSYSYGTTLKELRLENKYIDREGPPVIDRIRSGSGSYAFDSKFDPDRVETLKGILKELKDKNYFVVGLNLPFSTEVYAELKNNPRHMDLYTAFEKNVPEVFQSNGFTYFNFGDLKELGLNDLFMFDGVHSSETAMAEMLKRILTSNELEKLENKKEIAARLATILQSSKTSSFELDQKLLKMKNDVQRL